MNQTYAIPTRVNVVIANVLTSGAAFACRMDDGINCYVPVNVANSVNAQIGDQLVAMVVPNRYADKIDRTPWLVVHLSVPEQGTLPLPEVVVPPKPVVPVLSVYDRVAAAMKAGGVWTVASMFADLFPDGTREGDTQDYSAVSTALRKMFEEGRCAKFSMWKNSNQSKASREWFTCYPEKADVDEWEE